VRTNVNLPSPAAEVLDMLCRETRLTRPQVVRQALGVLQAMHERQKQGEYVGSTRNREMLDTVIVTPV